jgi:Glycosyl hydrolases family 16
LLRSVGAYLRSAVRAILSRSLVIFRLLLLPLILLAPTTAMARTISWSGYKWDVRPSGIGGPGRNQWSDSTANVRVEGSDLVLSIVRDASGCWTSAEVDNRRHLGYGTYRWIVTTDLSALDAGEVLGMFTYGDSDASHNEIDLEASHWGNLSWPTGSATVWRGAAAADNESETFRYSNRPPYVNQFRWEPGKVTFLVTDAAGATLADETVTRGVPTPSDEVPMINYWRYGNAPPAGERSMRISSFTWIPLGHDDAPPVVGELGATGASGWQTARSGGGGGGGCVRIAMRPRRFALAGPHRGATITWLATAPAKLRMLIERRVETRRWLRVGMIRRAVRKGGGRMRFGGRVGGRRLRPGRYRLVVRTNAGSRTALRFRVLAR